MDTDGYVMDTDNTDVLKMAASSDVKPKAVNIIPIHKQKKALAKKKKTVRNLLVNPFDDFWPVLKSDENFRMSTVLRRIVVKSNIGINNMKLEEKESLKKKRKRWSEFLAIGVNVVSTSVKSGSVVGVLLDASVDPKFLVQHVALMCGTFNVPVLAVFSLRTIMKELLGFSCIAIGIKKIVAESVGHGLNELYELFKELAEVHKPPPEFRRFNIVIPRTIKVPAPVKEKTVAEENSAPSTDLYLYRTSPESRVFVPESRKIESDTPKVVKPREKFGDFLSLGDVSEWDELMDTDPPVQGISYSILNPPKKPKREYSPPSYVPFKHVKVRPNPNKKLC